LFVTRRRAWIRVHEADETGLVRVEFAALARGDDPGLEAELERLVADFSQEHDHKLVSS
jgi:cytochrome c biogenesis protein